MKPHRTLLAALAALALFAACASTPASIPDNLSASELVQRAQEASDGYRWDSAIAYYEAARERFGYDPAIACMVEYEIAFIRYKQGKYAEAEKGFLRLLSLYEAPEGSSLPPRYKVLAEKVLPKVREALGKK